MQRCSHYVCDRIVLAPVSRRTHSHSYTFPLPLVHIQIAARTRARTTEREESVCVSQKAAQKASQHCYENTSTGSGAGACIPGKNYCSANAHAQVRVRQMIGCTCGRAEMFATTIVGAGVRKRPTTACSGGCTGVNDTQTRTNTNTYKKREQRVCVRVFENECEREGGRERQRAATTDNIFEEKIDREIHR